MRLFTIENVVNFCVFMDIIVMYSNLKYSDGLPLVHVLHRLNGNLD
jgi:hypothetical protein